MVPMASPIINLPVKSEVNNPSVNEINEIKADASVNELDEIESDVAQEILDFVTHEG